IMHLHALGGGSFSSNPAQRAASYARMPHRNPPPTRTIINKTAAAPSGTRMLPPSIREGPVQYDLIEVRPHDRCPPGPTQAVSRCAERRHFTPRHAGRHPAWTAETRTASVNDFSLSG